MGSKLGTRVEVKNNTATYSTAGGHGDTVSQANKRMDKMTS